MPTPPHRDLRGLKARVTGATSGLGRAIALQLARDGADVIVHGRDRERGAATVRAGTTAGGQASFVGGDLSNPAEIARLVSEVGVLDILVNNAGFAVFSETAELKAEQLDAL